MGLTTTDYLRQLQALLPPGPAWSNGDDSTLAHLLSAQAAELARVDDRALNLVHQADPRTVVEFLADWESVAGLPDVCTAAIGGDQVIADRRAALVGHLTTLGGQSAAYFIGFASALGYAITITEFRPFRAGGSSAGDPCSNDDWLFVWRINAPQSTITSFRAGQSAVGESIRMWGDGAFECVMGRLKPAHSRLLFGYGVASYVDEEYIDVGYFD